MPILNKIARSPALSLSVCILVSQVVLYLHNWFINDRATVTYCACSQYRRVKFDGSPMRLHMALYDRACSFYFLRMCNMHSKGSAFG